MNNTYSLEQISKTRNLETKLALHQYKKYLMSRFMEIEFINRKRAKKQVAQQLGYSDFTSKRCRDQIHMPCPYNRKNTKGKR